MAMAYLSMPFARRILRPNKMKMFALNCRWWFVFFSFSKCHTDKNLASLLRYFVHWFGVFFCCFCSETIKIDKKWDGSIVGKMFVICSLVALQFMRFLLQLPRFVRCVCVRALLFFFLPCTMHRNSVSFFSADINLAIVWLYELSKQPNSIHKHSITSKTCSNINVIR